MDPTLKDDMLLRGLYLFWNPAILDWRTWRKFGEHGENGKHQPDKVKHSMIKITLFMAQNTILQRLSQQLKNHNIQLGEHDPGSAQNIKRNVELLLLCDDILAENCNDPRHEFVH